jgi:hypothetical protein
LTGPGLGPKSNGRQNAVAGDEMASQLQSFVHTVGDFLGTNKDAFSSASTLFALIIFAFAVFQYRRGETWKKSEFLAKLYKDFVDDAACQRAMSMLDWHSREINFGTDSNPIIVDYDQRILLTALRKHDGKVEFTTEEMRIRDTFDRFFIFIEQFERAIQNRVMRPRQVYPYFAYWIDLLAGRRHLPAPIRTSILAYIDNYGFKDVRLFLNRWP